MAPDLRQALSTVDVYYGWVIVGACFLGAMSAFGTMYSFSVFFGYIAAEFQQTTANTSAIFSLQSFVTFSGAAIVGLSVDRFGVRRLMVLSIVLVGTGLLGASQLTSMWGVALAYGIVAAAGFAIVIPITFATIPRWFGRRRGMANGLATSGTGIGIVLAPPFANTLIDAVGWRNAYVGFTLAVVASLGIAALVLADGPGDVGADSGGEFADGGGSNPGGELDGGTGSSAGELDAAVPSVRDVVGRPSFLIVFVAVLLAYVPAYVVFVFLVEFAETAGIGRTAGVVAISTIGAVSIVGRNVAGVASDRYGRARILAGCGALSGLATVGFALSPSPTVLIAVAVAFGIGYGGMAPLIAPLLAELFGTSNVYALFGVTAAAWAVSGSATPYLSGLGYDVLGSYLPVYAIAGGLGVLAGVAFLVSTRLAPETVARG